jgi:hypothetical protein
MISYVVNHYDYMIFYLINHYNMAFDVINYITFDVINEYFFY